MAAKSGLRPQPLGGQGEGELARMRVLLLSRYGYLAASSRYRFNLYLSDLRRVGFEVVVAPLLGDSYLNRLYAGRSSDYTALGGAYLGRLRCLLGSRKFDLIWVQMEVLPWLPGWLEGLLMKLAPRYVVDYDDAWFHRYDLHSSGLVRRLLGGKIDAVMRHAALVVAGNEYIAERARRAGARRVEVLPTVIDLAEYEDTPQPNNETFTVGWIGSPSTEPYLRDIRPALEEVCRDGRARVVTIGANSPGLDGLPVELKPWRAETETAELQQFDVGVMPLRDSLWERGKCGFKLIQYMACARPVVASPVGMNREIVTDGVNGFLAETQEEWVRALRKLKADAALRRRMGEAGRARVEERYCLQVTAPRLTRLLREAAGKQCAELAADYKQA
jgi:glycosyltransferase involved in cell wall biosynthesis